MVDDPPRPPPLARRVSLICRCSLSTMPFAWGWKAVVGMCRTPYSPHQSVHVAEVNWTPLSEVRLAGTPKLATHVATKASRTASVVVSLSRTASGHLVDLSIMVSRWV